MIDDFRAPQKRKPPVIEPLAKVERAPLPVLDEDFEHPKAEAGAVTNPEGETIDTTPTEAPETEENAIKTTDEPAPEDTKTPVVSGLLAAKNKHGWRFWRMRPHWPPTKKELLIGGVAFILLVGIGFASWTATHRTLHDTVVTVHHKAKPKPIVPKTVASTLSGLQVDPSVNQRPVTGVMIENSTFARPQSGIDQASVVFEAIAEGGITRFLTLFQDTQPTYLGPVRSARPYYVQWCLGFDCSLAHVGGSPEALADIKSWNVKDLDQFANSGAYQRISSRDAPHNVYTSIDQLNQLESKKGFGASKYTGFARKADAASKTPNASSIDFAISGADFNTHYDYVAKTNSYNRSVGGAAHTELNKDGGSVPISPKVVIGMVMQYGLEADDHHSQYNVIGTGQAFIFQDGTVTTGTWSKTDAASQITFTDAGGKPLKLNAGQTWLTAISAGTQATYH